MEGLTVLQKDGRKDGGVEEWRKKRSMRRGHEGEVSGNIVGGHSVHVCVCVIFFIGRPLMGPCRMMSSSECSSF